MPETRIRRPLRFTTVALATVLLVACTGPDTRDDSDPTPTATATATATVTPSPEPSPTPSVVEATPTQEATPPPASPTIAASPTPEASPTMAASPTVGQINPREQLPLLAEMPGEGYIIAEEGTRTGDELALAYSDPDAHRRRLEEWGFQQHHYRAFVRDSSSDDDPLPYSILATINEYGSPEQAELAIQWLKRLTLTQGATEVDAPRLGDLSVALILPTAGGEQTASIYIRQGEYVYVYFAQGGDPLPAVESIVTKVFSRR
jgi:hypothetical protein